MMRDPLYQRLQLEFGLNFRLLPSDDAPTWRKWAFDPFFGVTLIGQQMINPRAALPKLGQGFVDELPMQPLNGMKQWNWVSRCFWLRFGCRILGIDIGFGLFYRKRIEDNG